MVKRGAPWRNSVRAGQETSLSAVPPPCQEFSALSDTVVPVAGWVCRGEGCQIGRSMLPFHLFGPWVTSLAVWQPWCWFTGALTLASSVPLSKPFHLSEP